MMHIFNEGGTIESLTLSFQTLMRHIKMGHDQLNCKSNNIKVSEKEKKKGNGTKLKAERRKERKIAGTFVWPFQLLGRFAQQISCFLLT